MERRTDNLGWIARPRNGFIRRDGEDVGCGNVGVFEGAEGAYGDGVFVELFADGEVFGQCGLGWVVDRLESGGARSLLSNLSLSPLSEEHRKPTHSLFFLSFSCVPVRQTGEPVRHKDMKSGIFEIDWNDGVVGVCRSDRTFSVVSVEDLA